MLKVMDVFAREKPHIKRGKLYAVLRSLNLHIMKMKQDNPPPRSKKVSKTIEDLYQLKEDVILKLLRDGHLRVRYEQCRGRERFYVFRANREITFHLPINKNIKAAVKLYEEKNAAIRPEEGD